MGNDFKIASPDSLMDIPVGSVILVGSKWEEEEAWDDSSPWLTIEVFVVLVVILVLPIGLV